MSARSSTSLGETERYLPVSSRFFCTWMLGFPRIMYTAMRLANIQGQHYTEENAHGQHTKGQRIGMHAVYACAC